MVVAQRPVIVSPGVVLRLSERRYVGNRSLRWIQALCPNVLALGDLLDLFQLAGLAGPERFDLHIDRTRQLLQRFNGDGRTCSSNSMRVDPRLVNKQHLAQLIELDLIEMQGDVPYLTIAGQDAVWKG